MAFRPLDQFCQSSWRYSPDFWCPQKGLGTLGLEETGRDTDGESVAGR